MSSKNRNAVRQAKHFISTPEIPVNRVVNDDERRTISEVILPRRDGTVQRVTSIAIKASTDSTPATLGNHYHDNIEQFAVINGSPELKTAMIDNPSRIATRTFPEGGFVTIEPGEVHAFTFHGAGDLRSMAEGTFEELGTHPHKLT